MRDRACIVADIMKTVSTYSSGPAPQADDHHQHSDAPLPELPPYEPPQEQKSSRDKGDRYRRESEHSYCEMPFAHVLLFEDGKVSRIRQYLSRDEALEAAGLSE